MAGGLPESVGGRGEYVSISKRGKPVNREAKFGGSRANSVSCRMNPQVAGVTLLVIGTVS